MPTLPLEEDYPAVTDEEIWEECASRLRVAIEAEGDNRAKAIEALEFLDGQQWPEDLYNKRKIARRPSLTINHTKTFNRRVCNNMRQQRPRIKVHPVGDGADIDKADVIGGLIRHIENASKASIAYDTAGESAVNIGWGYIRLVADYLDEHSMDQEIKIMPVRNTFTVYMDPNSTMPAGEDADWVIITETMNRKEYKRKYPKAENVEFIRSGVGDSQAQWETKTQIRLAEYYRITKRTETLYELSNGMTIYAKDRAELQPYMDQAQATIVRSRPSYRKSVEWFRVNGKKIVDRRAVGGKDDKGPLPGPWIPVIRCEGNVLDLNGRVRRKGMTEDMMDPARMLNYWETCKTEQLALASKAPWVGAEGFRDGHPEWDTANQEPYSALEYKVVMVDNGAGQLIPVPPPQRQDGVPLSQGFVQASESALQALMQIAGMPHEPGQDSPGAIVSGVALQRRQALSDMAHYQFYDNQTQMIAQCGRVCLSWIPIYYSTQRMQRIIGEDGVPSIEPINTPQGSPANPAIMEVKNDLTVGRYDVVMDTGPGYDTKRQEGAESMTAVLATPLGEEIAKVGADIVLRSYDWAGASDLADRMMPKTPDGMKKIMDQLPKQAQNIVQSFIGQLNQAQQKISQLEADLKYGLTKTMHQDSTKMSIETMKDKRAEKDTNTDSATKRFDTHVKSITARDVAEIKVGGEIMRDHVGAKYDEAARKDELKAAEKAEKSTSN
jgi:hypothetical protein